MTDLALAIVLGGAFGVGVALVITIAPRWGAPSLQRRIAPYVRDISDPLGLTPIEPVSAHAPLGLLVRQRVERLLGGGDALAAKLRQAGRRSDRTGVSSFRARQLAWAVVGLAVGGALVVVIVLAGRFSPAAVVVPVIAGIAAGACPELLLSRAASSRVSRVEEELPTVLEFLALCLSAGESILDAIRRVGDVGAGELTGELRTVVLTVGAGASLAESLNDTARGLGVPALTRATDHIVAALDRGAPLAQVLQAQAGDAREDAKRSLIERAGRKEIYMLLPLVFMILPLSVVFAVFPGVFMLRLGLG
ncbi:type II secretion system F family protein [Microbacterium sp.]|uniref:type II secretion system F family protein n=1 Tax=Microbacterium sp. TaxID=51671 RepID=UPI003A8E57CA